MWKIILAILFTLYPVWYDHLLWNCPSSFGKVIFLFHHAFCTMIFFAGPLFGLHYFNILCILLTTCSWLMLNNKCILTMFHNHLCGYNNKKFLYIVNIARDFIHQKTGVMIHWKYDVLVLMLLLVYNIISITGMRQVSILWGKHSRHS